ncbi:MAG: Ig-like domain-containing protein [Syntrophomonadaceae bacterium]
MLKSKCISILAVVSLCLTMIVGSCIPTAQAVVELSDISDNWAFSQIFYLVDKGVVAGYADGTFRPNNPISRAEFITITNRAFGYVNTSAIQYTDVKTSDWFYGEIGKAKAAGYIAGFSDGSMRPNNQISRQEVAAIMARVLNLDTSGPGELSFVDADSIPDWSRNAIAAMVKAGYISGYPDGNFRPNNAISRAEAAVIISLSIGNRVAVSGISLDKPAAVVAEGESILLTATITPADATNQRIIWASSDKNTAIVSTTGKVTGVTAGKATISATTLDGGFRETCLVTVVPPVAVTGVSLNQTSLSLTKGFTSTLAATVMPGEATNRTVSWSSSDATVATVDNNGVVTAAAEGSTTITARTLDGGYSAVCQVTVTAPVAVSGVSLNKPSTVITIGYSETLEPVMTPDGATDKSVTWSSDNPSVATVSSTGKVTAVTAGSTVISVKTNDGGFVAKCTVSVIAPIAVTSVSINATSVSLKVGETVTLKADISPTDATNVNVDWFTTDSKIASVNNGLVTGVAPGIATIMVRTQDGGKTDICDVTVAAPQ